MATIDFAFFPKINAGLGNESAAPGLSGATGGKLLITANQAADLAVPAGTSLIRVDGDADFTIADTGTADGNSIPHKANKEYFYAGVSGRTISLWSAT